jgi:chaperonin cofactor prefoldin
MGNKNESIFLWMLEQERQKSRTHVVEETNRDLVELPTTADQPPESEKPQTREDKPTAPKENTDLERLMKEKESLESESRRLDEEQEKLNLRVKALCEKIIQQTKKKNSEKKQAANQLQTRIDSLEAQLNALLGSGTQEE